jgi:hypothetical protein
VLEPQYKERLLGNATVVSVSSGKNEVRVTYYREGKIATVSTKAVIVCAPKLIASRLVGGLPEEQKSAMHRTRYIPYPVINLIFDKPIYNRGYDTWCPGNSFTDFIVADWTVRNTPGHRQKHNINASLYSTTTIAKLSPLACLPTSKNSCPSSTPIPSKCVSTAAAIPCLCLYRVNSQEIVWTPRSPWTAFSSATPIPEGLNPSPANPSASRKPLRSGPRSCSPANPAQSILRSELWR